MLLLTLTLGARLALELYAADHEGRTLLVVADLEGNALAFVEGAEC
jgi:hypothetical protein